MLRTVLCVPILSDMVVAVVQVLKYDGHMVDQRRPATTVLVYVIPTLKDLYSSLVKPNPFMGFF
jgi:predicted transglutaminase-like protease